MSLPINNNFQDKLFLCSKNWNEKENKAYTYILYATLPIQLFFLVFFFYSIAENGLTTSEYVGRIFSMGIMCGVIGINVGHELGHRNNRIDEFIGESYTRHVVEILRKLRDETP